eukprot:scaffold7687_cov127-Isochrysis_galbana.AAC.3
MPPRLRTNSPPFQRSSRTRLQAWACAVVAWYCACVRSCVACCGGAAQRLVGCCGALAPWSPHASPTSPTSMPCVPSCVRAQDSLSGRWVSGVEGRGGGGSPRQ